MKTMTVFYQAAGAGSGVAPQVDVFKPDKTKDEAQSGVATEIGTTGRYYKSFDVDAPDWFCEIADTAGGKAIKHFGKDAYDSHGIADAVADVNTAVLAVSTAIGNLQTSVSGVDTTSIAIKVDTENIITACEALETHLSAIEAKVTELTEPPMIG
jgi:hypothetical protein